MDTLRWQFQDLVKFMRDLCIEHAQVARWPFWISSGRPPPQASERRGHGSIPPSVTYIIILKLGAFMGGNGISNCELTGREIMNLEMKNA